MAIPLHGNPRIRFRRCRSIDDAVEDGTTCRRQQVFKVAEVGLGRGVFDDGCVVAVYSGFNQYVMTVCHATRSNADSSPSSSYGMVGGTTDGWTNEHFLAPFLISCVLTVVFFVWESKIHEDKALLSMKLLKLPNLVLLCFMA